MVDTCTEFYGDLPTVPSNIQILIIIAAFDLCCRALVYYIENHDTPPNNPKEADNTSFGLGAKVIVKILSTLCLAFSLPTIVLWFIFSNMDDFSSKQFACQVQGGTPWMVSMFISLPMFLIVATNYMRKITRFSYAKIVSEYLRPANRDSGESGGEVMRIANLPAYRGVWISPFARAFEDKCRSIGIAQDHIELIALDCFESVYNAENSQWLKANMVVEKLEHLKILWTDYTTLPLDAESVDVFMVPLGSVNPYLNGVPGEETTVEQKKKLTVDLVRACCRTLKPNGVLIASNIRMLGGSWDEALEEVGLEVTVLSSKVWWSYMPAVITVARRTAATTAALAEFDSANVEGGNSNDDTISALHEKTSEFKPKPSDSAPVESLEMERADRFSTSVGPVHAHSAVACCPPGSHWVRVHVLLLITFVAYIGFVVLTWLTIVPLQVPYDMPFDQMVSAMMIGNSVFLPVAIYGMVGDLRRAAAYADGINLFALPEDRVDAHAVVMKIFNNNLVNILVVLTISTCLGWLPYFSLDLFLIKVNDSSIDEVTNINQYVSIVVICLFFPIVKWLYGMYQKREAAEEKERQRAQEAVTTRLSTHSTTGTQA